MTSGAASLYIHIPFCERKCLYCDFFSVEGTQGAEDFLGALGREICLREENTDGVSFDTIFFGGGTPSLLEPDQLQAILSRLRTVFRIGADAEVTLEANPGTVTGEKLRAFRSLGINRLSIGIQSFHDPELKALGRIHDRGEALRCLELARGAGFDNVGIDLIYSIPGQTLTQWEDSLQTAVARSPQHIAAYSLIVEEGTPLAEMVRCGRVRMNAADLEAEMYERTMGLLGAHGYEHYEVSNYALPGFRCRHNCAYWSHRNYLGFGPSAHSFRKENGGAGGRRWWNVGDLPTYVGRLNAGMLPVESEEALGPRELLDERILLGLRTGALDVQRLSLDFGDDFNSRQADVMRWLIEERLALSERGMFRLTSKGFLLCDEIISRLLR
ncbi:MAG TPA: radical SAM family heme chaperone HemW [Candidatus Methylomirabilis sp.]|nr:radical SAM family heme chaperone HemW [Candidatus Methylomirabilis sp.]